MIDWRTLLQQGDFSTASHWADEHFREQPDSPDAVWTTAEILERWGDSLFFRQQPGARPHYVSASAVLTDHAADSSEEAHRRTAADERVWDKIRAVDASGHGLPWYHYDPHPAAGSEWALVRQARGAAPPPEPEPQTAEDPFEELRKQQLNPRQPRATFEPIGEPYLVRPPDPPLPPEPRPAAQKQPVEPPAQQASPVQPLSPRTLPSFGVSQTPLARLLPRDDHWRDYWMGRSWCEAAQLFPRDVVFFARACAWSMWHYERYHEAWRANLPSSRWDSDGGAEMTELLALQKQTFPEGEAAPAWAHALAAGDIDALWPQLPASPPAPLRTVLTTVTEAAGLAEMAAAYRAQSDATS